MTAAPIAIAAGGTGGHTFPAEALARRLLAHARPVLAFTDARTEAFGGDDFAGLERIVLNAATPAGGPTRKARAAASLVRGAAQARAQLCKARPACLVSFGSYAAVPASAAARLTSTPLLLHEQNAVLGRAHRLFARSARQVATSFSDTAKIPSTARKQAITVGNPVRPAIQARANRPYPEPSPAGPLHLFVFGGSQGARALGQVIPQALAHLPMDQQARLQVVHQVRPDELGAVQAAYEGMELGRVETAPFFDDAAERLAQAHLVIARAGASTVAEITAIGRPAILVPLPHAVDDHQSANAQRLDAAGAGWHLPQRDLGPASLAARLAPALADPAALCRRARAAREMGAPAADQALADLTLAVAGGATPAGGRKPAEARA